MLDRDMKVEGNFLMENLFGHFMSGNGCRSSWDCETIVEMRKHEGFPRLQHLRPSSSGWHCEKKNSCVVERSLAQRENQIWPSSAPRLPHDLSLNTVLADFPAPFSPFLL